MALLEGHRLAGSWLPPSYALFRHDSVFIFANLFNWIPYIRNLVIQRRHAEAHADCPKCGKSCPPLANFCADCGARLVPEAKPAAR